MLWDRSHIRLLNSGCSMLFGRIFRAELRVWDEWPISVRKRHPRVNRLGTLFVMSWCPHFLMRQVPKQILWDRSPTRLLNIDWVWHGVEKRFQSQLWDTWLMFVSRDQASKFCAGRFQKQVLSKFVKYFAHFLALSSGYHMCCDRSMTLLSKEAPTLF
jgi:hypothetical protein